METAQKLEVQLFIPCFVDQVFPQTGWNCVKLLEYLGCQVHYNPEQTCCGQPAWNAGHAKPALGVANKWLKDFAPDIPIVSPSGSCTGMVRNYYPALFEGKPNNDKATLKAKNTFELASFIYNQLDYTSIPAPTLQGKAVYHDACAALRELGIKSEPRKLLKLVQGLELVEAPDAETCCGFGGTFAVKYAPISTAMAEQKVENALNLGADYMISTDLSCLMHMQAYIDHKQLPLRTLHLVDVLASSLPS